MPAECAIFERPVTIADLPDLLPAVLKPVYDQVLPGLARGVTRRYCPSRCPAGYRLSRPGSSPRRWRRDARPGPGGRVPVTVSQPGRAGDPVVVDEAGVARTATNHGLSEIPGCGRSATRAAAGGLDVWWTRFKNPATGVPAKARTVFALI